MKQCILLMISLLLYSCVDKPAKVNEEETIVKQSSQDTTSVFTWATELCENKGTFNPQKYSSAQLQNTYDLWFNQSGILLEADGTILKPEDIYKLDTNKLIGEYEKKKKYLEQLSTVNASYWQKLKQIKMQELEDEYELKKITIQAYNNPSVLSANRFSKYCPDFVKVLTTSDTTELMAFWKKFSEEQSLKNGSPEQYMAKFYEKYHAEDRLEYAKVDLITYGWWNCANSTLTHFNRDTQMEEEFNKLFQDITSECDEP